MKSLANLLEFYELFKMLDLADQTTITNARSAGTEDDVVVILEDWQTTHSNSRVREKIAQVLANRAL